MRLTHAVTIRDDARPEGRKTVYAQVNLDPNVFRPLEIVRFDPTKTDDEGTSVTLTWEEFARIADLVWAHQPEADAREVCGYEWTVGAVTLRCCLAEGHENTASWLHVSDDGSVKTR